MTTYKMPQERRSTGPTDSTSPWDVDRHVLSTSPPTPTRNSQKQHSDEAVANAPGCGQHARDEERVVESPAPKNHQ